MKIPEPKVPGFERLLEESVRTHGHLCPGQVLGVRMSLLGLREIGIVDPKGKDRKNVMVFVEIDRCATDAIQSVTGCSLGHRTMKFLDYGKMAATFVNLKTGKVDTTRFRAVRLVAREESREKAKSYFSEIKEKYTAQLEAYKIMPEQELFEVTEVKVDLRDADMPGRPLGRKQCSHCGEHIQDMREVYKNNKVLCRPCASGCYYTVKEGFSLPADMQKCQNGLDVRSKLWLEIEGEPVFGRGRRFLLEAIDQHGSIQRAAQEINISYRKAWSYLNAMEQRLKIKLVERHSGGKHGGGATLTDAAREFMQKFKELEKDIHGNVDRRFQGIFGIQ